MGLGDKKLYGNGLVNAGYAIDFYNDFADVKSGKKDKITKIKKQKNPEPENPKKAVDPGVTAAGTVETYYLDSPHPYSDNYYNTWTISKSGATNIRVRFSYIQVETNWDYVTTDAGDTWTGSYSDVWSSWSGSSSITVRLSSDGSVTYNGFQIDKIEYTVPTDDYGNTMSSATLIQVGSSYSGNINYGGDVDFFKFTPTVSGNYVIASSGSTDTYGYLYNSSGTQLAYNDDSNGTLNFTIAYNLTAYQTYYVQVKHFSSSGTGTYGLNVTAPIATDDYGNTMATATTILYNNSRSGNIDYAGDVDYFKFIPAVSKSYIFKSTGSTDTYGYLYDSNGNQLNYNDDYGTLNFNMTQYLTAYQTYYLKVRHYSSTSTGAYSIIVTDAILGDSSYVSSFTAVPQSQARLAFDQIISDVDNYGNQLNDFGSSNVTSFNSLVSNIVKMVGSVDKVMHFARNKLNRAPASLSAMVQYINSNLDKKWRLLPPEEAAYHMNGVGGEYNLKFISPDGHFEGIYNSVTGTLVSDSENMGTYNYVDPSNTIEHTIYDVNPFYKWGNIETGINRSLTDGAFIENLKAADNLAKYYQDPTGYAQYFYEYYRSIIP